MTEEDKKLLNTFEGKLRHFMYLYEEQQKEMYLKVRDSIRKLYRRMKGK